MDRPAEPARHGDEPGRIRFRQRVQQGTSGHPVGAQAVQDRTLESGLRGERGIGVQWIAVTGKPVQQCLLGSGRAGYPVVRLTTGLRPAVTRPPVTAEAALPSDEDGTARGDHRIARARIHGHRLAGHQRTGSLVVHPGDLRGDTHGPRRLQGPMQVEGLLRVDEHRRVEVADAPAPAPCAASTANVGRTCWPTPCEFSVVKASSRSGSSSPAPTPTA